MKRIGSPCPTSPGGFECYNNVECSRDITPRVGPSVRSVIPVRGYWISQTTPLPVEYRSVFLEPPPTHGQHWYPTPIVQYEYNTPRPIPPPPLPQPFYGPCVYNQNYSPSPHYSRTNQDIVVGKKLFPTTPTSDTFHQRLSTFHTINPSASPMKQRTSPKASWEHSFETPKHNKRNKKCKMFQQNLVDKVEVHIKEKNWNWTYNKSNNELHPEILATWRKNLNKSKEISSTHKVKIEICLKKETNKQNQNIEGGKKVQEESDFKINQSSKEYDTKKFASQSKQQNVKMSSSNSTDSGKSSVRDGFDSLPVSPTRDQKLLVSDDKTSALRFTPSQIHKVHKKKKDSNHRSMLKRKSHYVPILEALETCRSRDRRGESPTENKSSTSDKNRNSEITRKFSLSNVAQESCRSTHKSERVLDSCLETYRSKEEYNQSPAASNFSIHRSSVSPRKSYLSDPKLNISIQKSEHDSDSNDETPNSSIYVTPQGTPLSMKSKEAEERQHSRFKRSLSDEYNDESHSANSSFNNSGYYTPESSPSKFNSAKRLKTRWSDSSSFSQNNSSYLSWRHNTSCSSDQGIQPELIGYQMVGDSQFCRFGQQLLGLDRVPMANCSGRIGICVSGQTITDLHRRVRENFYPISDKIILMIGTNDFLRNVDVSTMCEELSALIQTLKKSASDIILLTLPPIPKLEKKDSLNHFKLLNVYNSHIRSLENGETLRIADVSPLYMTSAPYRRCRMHLFEVYFGGAAKRLDLIHLNRLGLDIIRKYILEKFL